MSAFTVHFAIGMLVGTGLSVRGLWRTWRASQAMAFAIRRWLAWSYGLGLYAVVPNLLARIGIPPPLCRGFWTNIFLFHDLLNRLGPGGTYKGSAVVGLVFGAQYGLLLLAIRRSRRPASPSAR